MTELLLLALLSAPVALFLLPKWRLVVWSVMFLLVFEGAIRKWLVPGLQAQVYLAKDGLLLLAYAGYLFHGPTRVTASRAEQAIRALMIACAVYYLIQIFNPYSPSRILSLFGFKNYAFYFPLVFLAARSFESHEHVLKALRRYAWCMIPVGMLGLLQFALGPSHWLNAYLSHDEGAITTVAQFGGGIERARTAGTFSYLSGYVTFLTAMCLLALGLIIGSGARLRGNMATFALLAACSAAMFTTGSRMGVLSIATGLLFMLSMASIRGEISSAFLWRGIAGIILLGLVGVYFADDAVDAFFNRATRVEDTTSRFMSPITETLDALSGGRFLGVGMASTHGGLVRTFMGTNATFHWLGGVLVEVEPARVMLETGVIGFLLNYALRLLCVAFAFRMALSFRSRLFGNLSSGLAFFFSLHLILFVVGSPTAGIYYWFGLGLLLAMQQIEKRSLAARHTSFPQPISPDTRAIRHVSPRFRVR